MGVPFPQGLPIRTAPGMEHYPKMPIMQGMAGDIGSALQETGTNVDEYITRDAQIKDMIAKRQEAMRIEEAKQHWLQKEHDLKLAQESRAEAKEGRESETYGDEKERKKDLIERTRAFYKNYNSLPMELTPEQRKQAARAFLAEHGEQEPAKFLESEFNESNASQAKGEKVNSRGSLWFLDKVKGTVTPIMDPETGEQLPEDPSYKVYDTVSGYRVVNPRTASTQPIEGESPGAFKAKQLSKEKQEAFLRARLAATTQLSNIDEFVKKAQSIANNPDLKYITGLGTPVKFLPGSDAANLDVALKNLIASSAIETMAQLKKESPTGSTGFGALSQRELEIILQSFSSLSNRMQSAPNMRLELIRIVNKMRKWRKGIDDLESEINALREPNQKNINVSPTSTYTPSRTAPVDEDPDGLFSEDDTDIPQIPIIGEE